MLLQLRKAISRQQFASRFQQTPADGVMFRLHTVNQTPITRLNIRLFNSITVKSHSPYSQAETQLLHPSPDQSSQSEFETPLLFMGEKDARIFQDPANPHASRTLALIHACLKLGDIERANSFMSSFKRLQPQLFMDSIDINVHNAFLEAFLNKKTEADVRKALTYYSTFEKLEVTPNLTTFALLIKGHISARRFQLMKLFYQEMLKSGYTINQLKRSSHLSDEDLDIFLKTVGGPIEELSMHTPSPRQIMPENERPPEKIISTEGPTDSGLVATQVPGVAMLKQTLMAAQSEEMDLYEKQLKLEESAIESAMERLRLEAEGRGDKLLKMNITPLRKAMLEWKEKLTELITQEQKRLVSENEESEVIQMYGKFFCMLNPEKMALIAIQDLLRSYTSQESYSGSPVGRAVTAIGSAIEQEYHAEQMKEKTNRFLLKDQENISNLYSSGKIFAMALRKIQAQFERERINSNWIPKWPTIAHVRVGSAVLGLLIDSAKIKIDGQEEPVPAFSHSHAMANGLRIGVVLFDPYIAELLKNEPSPSAFGPRFLPMLVIPKPWLTYNSGGFLTSRLRAMRCKETYEQIVYLRRADEMGMLTEVLTALDVLGSIRWRINTRILDIVKHMWNTGEEFAGIPPAHTKVEQLPKPADYSESAVSRRAYNRKMQEQENLARNNHSMRCDVNYKVEIANAFRDHIFYFPHNLDFRGRAYPIPPLFNHLGNDLCRGLLVFGTARPLGARGFVWLKIHLANLFGFDKYSFTEREQFTISHLDDIMDSADDPLNGRRWWLKAEDPWQCLAACQHVTAAFRSGDPESYMCNLPIHQDGTCNGLQHYAALGGDIEGARHVNLLRSDSPQDIYSGVLRLVNQRIDKDASESRKEAIALKGHVTRKVIKQTVMTNVYGVTFIGARAQILSQLKEVSALNQEDSDIDVGGLSFYLTHLVFASLGEIFSSAQAIQAWLNECAGRISSSVPADIVNPPSGNQKESKTTAEMRIIRSKQMTSVVWTTPLGLTIVQPYRAGQSRDVTTKLQTVVIRDFEVATPVNSRKQRTAFPPNFVHSLDASHMMMTALAMQRENISFASVHDSYWTHACDVDTMNLQIREQFIELHSKPILSNLLREFRERYKGYKRRVVQEKKSPQVVDIMSPDLILDEDEVVENGLPVEPTEGQLVDDLIDVEAPKSKKTTSSSATWADLDFPPLPPRGNFDVTQVKDSEYFFH